ncbi:putative membrane protein [Cylindrospermum stagnale PCC 7417]|uniref:Putative membrane protein n=1 Tax=Cylindrospermum stagnale PCC 7417 TaxID=56107 RepID=K9WZV7_9NOST|nr:MgtC/SapB family protein [Cylindrospermum stagnale]AFZ25900.1 putative membrane protein [Cylindrospermum stagnale PCC 7417]
MTSDYDISSNDWLNISFRLCLALLFGAVIGLERQRQNKPAGLRTHMLVSLASAIFTLIPMQISGMQPSPDAISRVIQGIATGVGFLGAGEIVRQSSELPHKPKIRGLTSAAAIWVSAALGITAGCGLWQLGLISVVLTFTVLNFFKKLEKTD